MQLLTPQLGFLNRVSFQPHCLPGLFIVPGYSQVTLVAVSRVFQGQAEVAASKQGQRQLVASSTVGDMVERVTVTSCKIMAVALARGRRLVWGLS